MNQIRVADTISVPEGAKDRLRSFYGTKVTSWLDTVNSTVEQAATVWDVAISGYHDHGWTSIIAHGFTHDYRPVLIKAVPDPVRYHRELATLRQWNGRATATIISSDDDAHVFLLATIGQVPGGIARPADHESRTAHRLPMLHEKTAEPGPYVPELSTLFRQKLAPQINASALLKEHLGAAAIEAIVNLGHRGLDHDRRPVMLHGDLYAENVIFDVHGCATFIDPRGVIGASAYDWAFWCLFYLDEGFERRLAMLDRLGVADRAAVLPWVVVLASDSLRHHLQAGDHQGADRLFTILSTAPVRDLIGT